MLHIYDDYKSLTARFNQLGLTHAAMIMALSLIGLQYWHDALLYQRSLIAQGQWWRLWTGSLVHHNTWHLLLNLGGLIIVHLLSQSWLNSRLFLGLTCIFMSSVGLGLYWFSPQVQWYVGFSGVLYGLFLLCGLQYLKQQDWLSASLILIGICAKSVGDWWFKGNALSAEFIQTPVIYAAHLYGMAAALVVALGYWLKNGTFTRVSPP